MPYHLPPHATPPPCRFRSGPPRGLRSRRYKHQTMSRPQPTRINAKGGGTECSGPRGPPHGPAPLRSARIVALRAMGRLPLPPSVRAGPVAAGAAPPRPTWGGGARLSKCFPPSPNIRPFQCSVPVPSRCVCGSNAAGRVPRPAQDNGSQSRYDVCMATIVCLYCGKTRPSSSGIGDIIELCPQCLLNDDRVYSARVKQRRESLPAHGKRASGAKVKQPPST
jgi:hypothetical protein